MPRQSLRSLSAQRIAKLFADLRVVRGHGRYARIRLHSVACNYLILDDWQPDPSRLLHGTAP
jgi:hypothetical protein